jgi:hypothetical protein
MPRNPSEVARLYDELEYWTEIAKSSNYSKSQREEALTNVRGIERQLGIDSKPYNSSAF